MFLSRVPASSACNHKMRLSTNVYRHPAGSRVRPWKIALIQAVSIGYILVCELLLKPLLHECAGGGELSDAAIDHHTGL